MQKCHRCSSCKRLHRFLRRRKGSTNVGSSGADRRLQTVASRPTEGQRMSYCFGCGLRYRVSTELSTVCIANKNLYMLIIDGCALLNNCTTWSNSVYRTLLLVHPSIFLTTPPPILSTLEQQAEFCNVNSKRSAQAASLEIPELNWNFFKRLSSNGERAVAHYFLGLRLL